MIFKSPKQIADDAMNVFTKVVNELKRSNDLARSIQEKNEAGVEKLNAEKQKIEEKKTALNESSDQMDALISANFDKMKKIGNLM